MVWNEADVSSVSPSPERLEVFFVVGTSHVTHMWGRRYVSDENMVVWKNESISYLFLYGIS